MNLRYPEDCFNVQAIQYGTFPMAGPWIFCSREDFWAVPKVSPSPYKEY
ncbi:UPF0182 family protein [Paraburkholderia fungorum]